MIIKEIDTDKGKEVNAFLNLPFRIYKDCPQWVPPLGGDERAMLNRRNHAFYRNGEAVFLMAFSQRGEPLGRLAVLDNFIYNQHNNTSTVFFYLFETVPDEAVAQALFQAAFEWAQKRGKNEMLGPKGFSALNGLGMLVKGFEYRPAMGIPYNHAYYPVFMDSMGFTPLRDILSGYLSGNQRIPQKIHEISRRVQEKRGLRVDVYRSRGDLRKMLPCLKDLYNGSLVGTSGNAPLTDAEVRGIADQILWFADPRLIKVLWKGERPVGFLLAYPDITPALQRTGGKLWPFGWLEIMKELRRAEWIDINGAGIIEEYRGLGGTAILFSEMEKSILAGGFKHADIVQVGVENERMQRELSSLGIDFYKMHRIYHRKIE